MGGTCYHSHHQIIYSIYALFTVLQCHVPQVWWAYCSLHIYKHCHVISYFMFPKPKLAIPRLNRLLPLFWMGLGVLSSTTADGKSGLNNFSSSLHSRIIQREVASSETALNILELMVHSIITYHFLLKVKFSTGTETTS